MDTQLLMFYAIAYGIGYGMAYFAQNVGQMAERFGIFGFVIIPIVFIVLLLGAGFISDFHNTLVSSLFAFGFIIKMIRREA